MKENWDAWCGETQLSKFRAALNLAESLPEFLFLSGLLWGGGLLEEGLTASQDPEFIDDPTVRHMVAHSGPAPAGHWPVA